MISLQEVLNKKVTTNLTYNDILKIRLMDDYSKEIDKIMQMSYEDFLVYFDNILEE